MTVVILSCTDLPYFHEQFACPQLVSPEPNCVLTNDPILFRWTHDTFFTQTDRYEVWLDDNTIGILDAQPGQLVYSFSYPLSSIDTCIPLRWFVRARNDFQYSNSDLTALMRMDTPQPVPTQPSSNFSADSCQPIDFSWESSSCFTHYILEWSQTPDYTQIEKEVTVSTSTYRSTAGVFREGAYYWRVRGRNQDVFGSWSASQTFQITVSGHIEAVGPSSGWRFTCYRPPVFQWKNDSCYTHYRLEIGWDDTFTSLAFETTVESMEYTFDGYLDQGRDYYWRVSALTETGQAALSSAVYWFHWSGIESSTLRFHDPASSSEYPKPHTEAAFIYDPIGEHFWMFGGNYCCPPYDTWMLDPKTWQWKNMTAQVGRPELDATHYDQVGAYDSKRSRFLIADPTGIHALPLHPLGKWEHIISPVFGKMLEDHVMGYHKATDSVLYVGMYYNDTIYAKLDDAGKGEFVVIDGPLQSFDWNRNATLVYVPTFDRFVYAHGASNEFNVQIFNPYTLQWDELSTLGNAPPFVAELGCVFDPCGNRIIYTGGCRNQPGYGEGYGYFGYYIDMHIYTLNLNPEIPTWEELPPNQPLEFNLAFHTSAISPFGIVNVGVFNNTSYFQVEPEVEEKIENGWFVTSWDY